MRKFFWQKWLDKQGPPVIAGKYLVQQQEIRHPSFSELLLCLDLERQKEVVLGAAENPGEEMNALRLKYRVDSRFPVNLDRHYELQVKGYTTDSGRCYVVMNKRKRLIDRYEILYERDKGAMGVIYKVKDSKSGEIFALKELDSDKNENQADRRMIQEGDILKNLTHQYILKVHQIFRWHGRLYLAMDYVTGENLCDLIARGPVSPNLALQCVRKTAQALAYIHDSGIIHRDIKPANIMLDDQFNPKLMDFGIAKILQPQPHINPAMNLTLSGEVLGTPRYMSPELIESFTQTSTGVQYDHRIDIFSLGVTLAEMLLGKYPFSQEPNHLSVFWSILNDPLPELPEEDEANRAINALLRGMLARDRDERIADMHAVAAEIDAILKSHKPKTMKIRQADILVVAREKAVLRRRISLLHFVGRAFQILLLAALCALLLALFGRFFLLDHLPESWGTCLERFWDLLGA